ncbi:MAG: TIGR02757 family protein [Bacteroidota bacterium]
MKPNDVKALLDLKSDQFNRPDFIKNDPIQIPHRFRKKQDIEIAGLFAATLAWGQRKTIINNCDRLMELMGNAPHDFILNHAKADLRSFSNFKHRTFNPTDLFYFFEFLSWYYKKYSSLEDAFVADTIEAGLVNFHDLFFSLPGYPKRTIKHISTPERKSACKRLNMYLRWMVRDDDRGVDFGIWKKIKPSLLICPCDVHVDRVARKLKLIKRKQVDWQTALELTNNLRKFDPVDPVKYDFALFGLGVDEKF